ncbi:unnamed protein product [Closterium sp. Naga37s-1]|nr:unnamed protein product [Closterium sp. Naga37s-1]
MVKRPKTGQQVRTLPPRVSACLSPLPPSPLPPRPPISPSPCPVDSRHAPRTASSVFYFHACVLPTGPPPTPLLPSCPQVCKECFFRLFESEIHATIVLNKLFKRGEKVAVAASGGKDSTVLAHIISLLNTRHDYGLQLFLLSIDEGITGYRDDSLETVKRNEKQYGIPLTILSYKDLYGWTMDEIVATIGRKNNCTFCGVFRRQALDRGAALLGADRLVTGHNADDFAETVLLNLLRGDVARLSRCAAITTGEDSALPRSKPTYAHFKKLDYFSTECIYSPDAYRGFAREFIKDLEAIRPRAILDIIKSAEDFRFQADAKMPTQRTCDRCGYISSQVRLHLQTITDTDPARYAYISS